MWEETLVFNIQMPQIALVRFQVWDHDPIGRDFIGQRTVAFTSMMPGRFDDNLPRTGLKSNCTLYCDERQLFPLIRIVFALFESFQTLD